MNQPPNSKGGSTLLQEQKKKKSEYFWALKSRIKYIDSSVHGILQARTLGWVAISFSMKKEITELKRKYFFKREREKQMN